MRPLLLLLSVVALSAAGCGGSSSDESASTASASITTTSTATTSADGSAGCSDASVPAARSEGGAKAPKERLDPEKTYRLVFDTNCGSFTVTLDLKSAPATSASLVSLAKSGFLDDTIFHRIVPGFVIQGGDPTQTGSGGPGYQTVDPPAQDAKYVKGVVAMAKTAAEPAGTSGSQFFVVTRSDAGLPPDYAIVGTVTDGMAVVEHIGTLGDPQTEQPTQTVMIHKVAVEEQ